MTITERIDAVETAVFDYEITSLTSNIVGMFSEIVETGAVDARNTAALSKLNAVMGDCLKAMQNKDFLLIADKLEYDLKPLLAVKQ